MRSIWSGAISFGLVNIPVSVYSATHSEKITFHYLHKTDRGRIHNKRVCEICNREVDYDDLVKGYEYEKGEYVVLDEKDFERIAIESTRTIAIAAFVDQAEIDPMFYDTPYYLAPGKNAAHVYALLSKALKESGKVGIAKVALREREHLAAIKPHGNGLVLETMLFADELASASESSVSAKEAKVSPGELKLALQLIDELSEKFKAADYEDTYREALTKLIEQKLKGKHVTVKKVASKQATTKVVDIMSRLKASLKSSSAHRPKARKKAKAA
jgi:DNA end-binding protein Ku